MDEMVEILIIQEFQMLNFWTFEPSNTTEFYFLWLKESRRFSFPNYQGPSCHFFPRLALQSGDTTRVEAEFQTTFDTFYFTWDSGFHEPYYWVDDHALLYGNSGSLDPSTHGNLRVPQCHPHKKYGQKLYDYQPPWCLNISLMIGG